MLATRKIGTWVGAAGFLGLVALLGSSCDGGGNGGHGGDEVSAVDKVHEEGPSLGLHRPSLGGFGKCGGGQCPCRANGKGFCAVCHLFAECVYCDDAAFCPKDPCAPQCPTSNHGPGKDACPASHPNDCGDGSCCPDSHPQCCFDGFCATADGSCN